MIYLRTILPVGFLERTVNPPPPFSSLRDQRVPTERKHRTRLRYYSHSQQLCLRPSLTAQLYIYKTPSFSRKPTKISRIISKTSALRALVQCACAMQRVVPNLPTTTPTAPTPAAGGNCHEICWRSRDGVAWQVGNPLYFIFWCSKRRATYHCLRCAFILGFDTASALLELRVCFFSVFLHSG